MRYVAAYALASLKGGEPTIKDVEKVLASVGIDCDAESAKKVVDELKGKNLQNIISQGEQKLGSVPSGAAPAGGAKPAEAAPAKEEKKEEKKEESEEESDEDMGFGLFD